MTDDEVYRLIFDYTSKNGYKHVRILSVDHMEYDPIDRVNVEISAVFPDTNSLGWQLLFIMNGEVIDGKAFHERISEFYPEFADA